MASTNVWPGAESAEKFPGKRVSKAQTNFGAECREEEFNLLGEVQQFFFLLKGKGALVKGFLALNGKESLGNPAWCLAIQPRVLFVHHELSQKEGDALFLVDFSETFSFGFCGGELSKSGPPR